MKYIKLYFAAIILLSLSPEIANAQPAVASDTLSLSLERCIVRALDANYSVVISDNNFKIAKNNVTLAPFL